MNVRKVELNLSYHKLIVNQPEIRNFLKRVKIKWRVQKISHMKDDMIDFKFCQNREIILDE